MIDKNITMFGYPGSYHQWMFNTSEIPALEKLAQTYHNPETWDEYDNDYEYYVQTKGTHANVYSYLTPWELKMGKWWRSTENIPTYTLPYGGWQSRINWYLNEV